MQNLPEYLNNHPFQRLVSVEMDEKNLSLKEQFENFHSLSKTEQKSLILSLMEKGISFDSLLKNEGFWCDESEKDSLFKNLPFPKSGEMSQEEINEFIPKLQALERKSQQIHYMGHSKCRLCGELNGTKTIYNDTFAWPEGLKHYIEKHGVMPSAAFVLHVRGLTR